MKIIQSLCDTDFYKLSMCQLAFHQFPTMPVEYKFKCRSKGVDLTPYHQQIRDQVDSMSDLSFTKEEINYLRNFKNGMFKEDFLNFLTNFKLNPSQVSISIESGELEVGAKGLWTETIFWEIYLLSIINEKQSYVINILNNKINFFNYFKIPIFV